MRFATWLIWGAYVALGATMAAFAVAVRSPHADVGVVFTATFLLGLVGTAIGVALLSGSVLGLYFMIRQRTARGLGPLLTVVAGAAGAAFLGWIAAGFWTH